MIRLVIAAIAWILVIFMPLLSYLGVIGPMPGFFGAILGALVGIVAAVVGLIAVVMKKRDMPSWICLASVIPFIAIFLILRPGLAAPPINDISTDLENPPEFTHAQTLPANEGRDFAYPEDFKPQVREAYADVQPITIDEPAEEVYTRAVELAKAQPGWEVTLDDAGAMTFEGVATTNFFKWKDDFIVRVTKEGDGAKVDMRSKSRDGKSDLGANAARIKAFFEQLQ